MSLSTIAAYVWSFVDFYTIAILLGVYWSTKYFMFHGFLFSKRNLVPGMYGLPIVGVVPYFFFSKKTVFEKLESYSKKYGPLLRISVGNKENMIFVTGTKAVREGMLNDDLLGRPKNVFEESDLDLIFTRKSIINIEGELWKKHRRFSLIALRDLGFGKTPIMEQRIQEEARDLINRIDAEEGKPFNIQPALVESTGNNINSLVFGGKFGPQNEKKQQIYEMMTAITKENETLIKWVFVPFAMKIMMKLKIGVIKRLSAFTKTFVTFLNEDFDSHKADLDADNPRDYVDHYLIAQEKDKDFTTELAQGNAMAFFFAGSSTVRVTLEYLVHLMAQYPEVQRKVQAEIDELTGRSREVTWADSQNLVYTMAVIAERHRYCTVAPAGVTRKVMKPTKLCGYDLQANDQVTFNIDSVHYDPELFDNPYEFKPDRFIDENGKLVNTEKVWAFSIGKRACPGESLAVLEVFVIFTTLLQNFNIEAVGPVKFRPLRSLIAETIPQEVRFIRRS